MSLSRFLTHHRRTDGISWGTQPRQLAYLGTQHGRHAAWKNACRPEPRLRRGSSVARVRTLLLCRQFTGSRRTRGDPGVRRSASSKGKLVRFQPCLRRSDTPHNPMLWHAGRAES